MDYQKHSKYYETHVHHAKGKIRITNGIEERLFSKNDIIPDGWCRGTKPKASNIHV